MAHYFPATALFPGDFFPQGLPDVELNSFELPPGFELPPTAAAYGFPHPAMYAHHHHAANAAAAAAAAVHQLAQSLSGDETGDSSAASPSSSASPAPEVPVMGSAGSPVSTAMHYTESKNEMVATALSKGAESASSAASLKRKASPSPRPEADTKAATPVQQLSKRQRANARNQKREAHNQAERERRDTLKEGFAGLRMALPINKSPDRKNMVDLLQAAVEYINELQAEVSDLRQLVPAAAH